MKKTIAAVIVVIIAGIILYTNLESRLCIKATLGMEMSLDEISNSKLYQKYLELDLEDTRAQLETKLGKKGTVDDWGLFSVWNFPYGTIKVVLKEDKAVYKMIVMSIQESPHIIENESTIKMNGYTTFEEVMDALGTSIEFGKSYYDENSKAISTSYLWKLTSGKTLKISFTEGTIDDISYLGW
ncbi:hypothetical protein [Fusibacter ferrireducens]|uniref:DUF3862 domain-containing protein n=1 Tax=Fusibacter ferrireducens TaxID=2785058 RepID=A0ABR9ZPZ1_9FIRM|nr:hypothetical protein [Fusibacter ferrireducens]MBF4691995.1 hypothetical protein [Fusibacter ferrireducens]